MPTTSDIAPIDGTTKSRASETFVAPEEGVRLEGGPGADGGDATRLLPRGRRPAPPPATACPERTGADAAGQKVLVAEDDPSLRALFESMIESLGFRARVAADGDEALRLVEREGFAPDLLITDVIMPGMNGPALSRRIGELRPGIPTLFISGYAADGLGADGVLEPGAAFLAKPFNLAELARKLRDMLFRASASGTADGRPPDGGRSGFES